MISKWFGACFFSLTHRTSKSLDLTGRFRRKIFMQIEAVCKWRSCQKTGCISANSNECKLASCRYWMKVNFSLWTGSNNQMVWEHQNKHIKHLGRIPLRSLTNEFSWCFGKYPTPLSVGALCKAFMCTGTYVISCYASSFCGTLGIQGLKWDNISPQISRIKYDWLQTHTYIICMYK